MKKVILSSSFLAAALKKLGQVVVKNPSLPVLKNLYLKVYEKEAELITTDLELTIIVTIPCQAEKQFEMLVPFEFLKKAVALAGNQPLQFAFGGKTVTITGENDSYELGSLEKVADFPNLPEVPKEHFVSFNGSFTSWLDSARATCSTDEHRPALTKICLDMNPVCLMMASTDATMIFTRTFAADIKHPDQLLISPKVAAALSGFDSTDITWSKGHIAFKSDNVEIIATRAEEKFPNIGSFFPDGEPNLVLNREALVQALQKACLSSSSTKHTVIYLKRTPATIHFEAPDDVLNRKILIDITGSYKGPLERIAVHGEKLLTLMEQVNYQDVRFALHDASKPIVITSESDPEYRALLVPLTVND